MTSDPTGELLRFLCAHPEPDAWLRGAGRSSAQRVAEWGAFVRRGGPRRVIAEVAADEAWGDSARSWVAAADVDAIAITAADEAPLAARLADLRGAPCDAHVVWMGRDVDLDALAAASGTPALDVVIACPSPADAAACFHRWQRAAHRLARSSLVPACAAPAAVPVLPAWPDEREAAPRSFAPACGSCRFRGGCEGLPSAWHEPGVVFTGPATFGLHDLWDSRLRAAHLDADAVELLALEAGLRRVWRLDLETARAELLADAIAAGRAGDGPFAGAGLHVASSTAVDLDARDLLRAGGGDARIVYVARAPADAERALAIEAEMAALPGQRDVEARAEALDRELGALLGYPSCCIDAFVRGHREWRAGDRPERAETTFYALRALARSDRLDPRLDFASPLTDACLIRHYACRFDCGASLALVAALETELARRGGRVARRSAATLLYPDAGAVALAGTPDGTVLHAPRVVPPTPGTTRAARSEALAADVAPLLSTASSVADAPDGAVLRTTDGSDRKLAGAPRLLVFAG